MKIDIKLPVQWLLANKISLNAGKTEVIIFRHLRKANGALSKIRYYVPKQTLRYM